MLGEMIFDVVNSSIRSLLNPEPTASWEKRTDLCGGGKHHGRRVYAETGEIHHRPYDWGAQAE